ncbi:MAG: FAD-binding oxidoreductase, partial [Candidatus Dormibacteraeota bacterium]|nr:FAD-binding oxidoreductase [Candidatus Dormibacteraeota bacterium]MBO0762336.1 FAD-binding oxidoreductase [Candidatus Dormibacteraeota bacterium]
MTSRSIRHEDTSGRGEPVDVHGLERELRNAVAGEVRFDRGARALYATDASNFRQPPIGVVIPKTVDDVVATHDVCRARGAPMLSRGCGTSLSGETVNHAVVIDFSKHLHEIGEVDAARRTVRCQPGAVNDQVNRVTKRQGLVFAPDPSTHAYCTIGGNIGNNSCGVHSVQARFEGEGGRTSDNVAELEILTYDGQRMRVGPTGEGELERIIRAGGRRGEIYAGLRRLRDRYADQVRARFPDIPRRVSGYNLDELLPEKGFNVARALTGTEGTCVTVLDATLKLVPAPRARSLLVLGYPDVFQVGDHVSQILEHRPIGCEAIDQVLLEDERQLGINLRQLSQLPEGRAWVLVEFGGDSREESDEKARRLLAEVRRDRRPPTGMSLLDDPEQERQLWLVREAGLGATAFPPDGKDHWPGWEDSAVAPEEVGAYLRDLQRLYDKHGVRGALYGHLGDGCIHSRISFDLRTAGGLRSYRSFLEEAADLVAAHGGSLSGEHGDGQQRAELLPRMYGEEVVQAFREFKAIWDPDGKMNPGKVVDPYRLDENLKLGPDYNPARPNVRFSYQADHGDFSHATLRCVGIGKCRDPEGVDVMCPSYLATREEKHSTRGRARLLWEMLRGEVIEDGWRSQEVLEALDLCLACKGCTNDCPVNVDMPTLKSEFYHHHYKGRLRPRQAYAFGLVDQAARVASRLPEPVDLALRTPGVSRLARVAAGMAPQREIPSFAPLTLRDWFFARGERNPGGPRVLLWPDTFNNYFHTDVGVAAVEALEAAGWQVVMPGRHLCCGRPLYDYGFLDLAERYLRGVLGELRNEIRAGTPVVGMEPSCLATFRHELRQLLPHDEDAGRLRQQSYHFGELLQAFDVQPPRLRAKALLWGHCHQKATGGLRPDHDVLQRMGVEV